MLGCAQGQKLRRVHAGSALDVLGCSAHAPTVFVHELAVFGSLAVCWMYLLASLLQVHWAVQLELSSCICDAAIVAHAGGLSFSLLPESAKYRVLLLNHTEGAHTMTFRPMSLGRGLHRKKHNKSSAQCAHCQQSSHASYTLTRKLSLIGSSQCKLLPQAHKYYVLCLQDHMQHQLMQDHISL